MMRSPTLSTFSLLVLLVSMTSASLLLSSTPFGQGNKRRTSYTNLLTRSVKGSCEDRIRNWNSWDTGFQANIVVHTKDEKAISDWSIKIELCREVDNFQAFSGQTDMNEGKYFIIRPASWNGEAQVGQEVTVAIQGQYSGEGEEPRIKAIKIKGLPKMNCRFEGEQEIEVEEQQHEEELQVEPVLSEDEEEQQGEQQAEEDVEEQAEEDVEEDVEEQAEEDVEEQAEEDVEEEQTSSTAVESSQRGYHVPWPKKVLGLYVLLADDDEDGFDSAASEWSPELYKWQQESSNVLFFTFIHPGTMEVPPSFQKLAATRGTNKPGAVPKDTVIIFAIGGYAYSLDPNPWEWLTSRAAAEAMAEKVAEWPEKYNCDGIDLDLEEGAGARKEAGPNMVHFIRRLRQLRPTMVISQPTYGYPQVQAEIDVINASWDSEGASTNLADSVGLMVYEGTQALNYVKNYAQASSQWEGFPVKSDVPSKAILLGAKGAASSDTLVKLANASVEKDLLGIMVWYASVKNGFDYAASWDASTSDDSIKGYKKAFKILKKAL